MRMVIKIKGLREKQFVPLADRGKRVRKQRAGGKWRGTTGEWREKSLSKLEQKLGAAVTPISRVFAYEWQGKDLPDRECVRVTGKGITGRHFFAPLQRATS